MLKRVLKPIVLLFMLIVCCVGVCGCGGSTNLFCKAMYSEREIILPIKANLSLIGANGMTHSATYESNLSLEEILPQILESEAVSSYKTSDSIGVSGRGDYLFFERANSDGTVDYCSLIVTGKVSNKKFYYLFSSLRTEILYEADSGEQQSFQILFPYHLVSDFLSNVRAYMSVEYAVKASIDEFYEFYDKCGWLDVERDESSIIIKGFKKGVTVVTDNAELPFSFKLSFRD